MNRLDKVVVFHPLQREQLEEVLQIELGNVQRRVLETAKGQFLFRVTDAGRDFLLKEGTDQRYGARHLKRAIERHVVYPLANLLATEQVQLGDLVRIDWDGEHNLLTFVREGEGALVNTATPQLARGAAAEEVRDGRSVDAPAEVVAGSEEIARGFAGGDSCGCAARPQKNGTVTPQTIHCRYCQDGRPESRLLSKFVACD